MFTIDYVYYEEIFNQIRKLETGNRENNAARQKF